MIPLIRSVANTVRLTDQFRHRSQMTERWTLAMYMYVRNNHSVVVLLVEDQRTD